MKTNQMVMQKDNIIPQNEIYQWANDQSYYIIANDSVAKYLWAFRNFILRRIVRLYKYIKTINKLLDLKYGDTRKLSDRKRFSCPNGPDRYKMMWLV